MPIMMPVKVAHAGPSLQDLRAGPRVVASAAVARPTVHDSSEGPRLASATELSDRKVLFVPKAVLATSGDAARGAPSRKPACCIGPVHVQWCSACMRQMRLRISTEVGDCFAGLPTKPSSANDDSRPISTMLHAQMLASRVWPSDPTVSTTRLVKGAVRPPMSVVNVGAVMPKTEFVRRPDLLYSPDKVQVLKALEQRASWMKGMDDGPSYISDHRSSGLQSRFSTPSQLRRPLQALEDSSIANIVDHSSSMQDSELSMHEKLLSRSIMHPEVKWGTNSHGPSDPLPRMDPSAKDHSTRAAAPSERPLAAAEIRPAGDGGFPGPDDEAGDDAVSRQLMQDIQKLKSRNFHQVLAKAKKDAEELVAERERDKPKGEIVFTTQAALIAPPVHRANPSPAHDGKGGLPLQCHDPSKPHYVPPNLLALIAKHTPEELANIATADLVHAHTANRIFKPKAELERRKHEKIEKGLREQDEQKRKEALKRLEQSIRDQNKAALVASAKAVPKEKELKEKDMKEKRLPLPVPAEHEVGSGSDSKESAHPTFSKASGNRSSWLPTSTDVAAVGRASKKPRVPRRLHKRREQKTTTEEAKPFVKKVCLHASACNRTVFGSYCDGLGVSVRRAWRRVS